MCYADDMTRAKSRHAASHLFLGIGYFSAVLQWLWVLLVALPPLIRSGAFDALQNTEAPGDVSMTIAPVEATPFLWLMVGLTTLMVLIVTVIVLIRVPRTIVGTSERIVQQATHVVVPTITHHKKLPASKQRAISRKVALSLRLVAAVLPFLICLFLPAYQELSREIILIISLWLAGISIASFGASWVLEVRPISRTRSPASRG
jgi:hypothetical protein